MNYFTNIKDILSYLPKKFIRKQLFITFLLLSLESFYFLYYTFLSKYFSEITSFFNYSFNQDFEGVTYVKFFIIFFVLILLPCKYFLYKKLSTVQIRHTYSMKNLFVKNYYNFWVDKYNNNLSFKDLILNALEVRFQQGVKSLFVLIQEMGVSCIIFLIIFASYPLEVISVFTLIIIYKYILRSNRDFIDNISKRRIISNKRLLDLYDFIDRDSLFISISGYRSFIGRRLSRIYYAYSNSIIKWNSIQNNLRNSQEALFYLVLCLFAFVFLMTSSDPSGIYTMTTTLFLGGLRMLPSVNRISAALNDIEFSSRFTLTDLNNSSIKRVYKEIEEINFIHSNNYYSIKKGEILLITGESGSGKSSFLKHLIFNDDVNLIKDISGVKNKIKSESLMISYVDQSCNLYPGSLNDNINKNIDGIDPKLFSNLLKKFGISVAETSDVSQLSGGQKQIFCVLRALFSDKTFVVLDEPTSSLDYESEVLLCEYIKKCSVTKIIIIVTHRPHPLTLSDLRLII